MTRSNLPTTATIYKGEQGEPFVFALLDSTAMLPCLAVVPTQSTLVSCSLPSFYVSEPTLNCCELLWVVLPLFYRTNPRKPCELLSSLFWCQIISSLMSKQLHLSPLSMSLKHSQPLSLCVRFSTHRPFAPFSHFPSPKPHQVSLPHVAPTRLVSLCRTRDWHVAVNTDLFLPRWGRFSEKDNIERNSVGRRRRMYERLPGGWWVCPWSYVQVGQDQSIIIIIIRPS